MPRPAPVIAGRLQGIDGRSKAARRVRAVYRDLLATKGDAATAAERLVAERAAHLHVELEQLEAAIQRGAPVDPRHMAKRTNTFARLIDQLSGRGGQTQEAPGESLQDYARRKAAEAAAGA